MMRSFITVFSLILVLTWSFSSLAADEKKIEKKIWVQKDENKAGLGIMVSNTGGEKDTPKTGALIVEVFDGSAADAIGLEKGDIIIEVNKKPINEPADLVNQMKDLEEGQEISLVVLREGQKKNFKATLKPFNGPTYAFHKGEFGDETSYDFIDTPHAENLSKYLQIAEFGGAEGKGGYMGVQVKNLTDQLQKYFEVKNGVLIEEVMKDSPAEKAGLIAGDVITSINDRKIEDPQDLVRTVNYYNADEEVEVTFARKGSREEVKVILAKKPGFEWKTQKMKGPHGLKVIREGDQNAVFMDEEGAVKVIEIDESEGKKIIELKKEILIL